MAELQANFELPRRSEIEATFEINVAVKGDTGNGIESIEKTSTEGLVDTYTIQYTDGNSTTFEVTNGKDGEDGKDGADGKDAKINGVNTLTLNASGGLSFSQSGSTATISGNTLQQAIGSINELIPEQASSENQLADKDFVNSSVATNTANFIGTFNSYADLEAYSGPLTNNDYAFVVGVDAQGNTVYDRYKYTDATDPASWVFEYELNNSSFTANQWEAINSGATDVLIAQITTNENAIGNLNSLTTSSQSDLVSAVNEVNSTAGSKVSDVTVKGTSVVNNSVAEIPLTTQNGSYGLIKLGLHTQGLQIDAGDGNLKTFGATEANIDDKTNAYRPITPFKLDYAVKRGVAYNSQTLTATEKSNACDWLGAVKDATIDSASIVNNGVAEIPIAQQSGSYGLVKFGSTSSGLQVSSGTGNIAIYAATNTNLEEKTNSNRPVVSSNLDYATVRGVAYNSLTMTATEKSDACDWLGAIKDATIGGSSIVTDGVAVIPNASGDTYGVTKLSNSLTSTSNTSALTPNALNTFAREIATGAPLFDKTLTYAVGDKVRYGTGYYECITAITSAHAWNASEWRQITIQGEIDGKQDILTPDDGGKYIDIMEKVVLPSGYSRLDYVTNEASASPYTTLDLGIQPQDGDIIESVFVVNKAAMSNYFVQARDNSGSAIYGLAGASSGSTISCAVNGITADVSITRQNGHKYYAKASMVNGTCSLYIKDMTDNLEDYGTNTYTWGTINKNYHLWGNGTNTMNGEQPVQFVKITNNSVVRCYLVAATDGVNAGFYDLVNGTFISSMTAGSVSAGNVIANPTVVNTTLRNKDFIYFGTSSSTAATVEKVVNIPEITQLEVGQIIIVQPTATSTVANSTIALNNFTVYPMRYNNAAITTSTDSIVWYANVPSWWRFDGTYWVFLGHGVDNNTTYNSSTFDLLTAGTNTTNRLVSPVVYKDSTFGSVTSYASGGTIPLEDKCLYNSTSEITALTLSTPTIDERYLCQVNFSSGTTATTLTYPNTFKVYDGCDDVQVVEGVKRFVPVSNKRYQVFIMSDGVNTIIFAKGA